MPRVHKKTILFSVIALLIVIRLCLPFVIKFYINRTLANDIDGYTGSISDVDLHLYRGAYTIDSLKILKKEGKVPVPFLSADKIDVSVEWKALLKGSLVAEISAFRPEINFVDGPSKAQTQTGEEGNWRETVNNLFPLQINTFTIHRGEVHFQNFNTSPRVDVYLSQLNLVAHNLTNSKEVAKTLASTIQGKAKIQDSGRLKLHVETNPLQDQPPFNLDLSISEVPITKLNDFLKAYANIDMEKGTFALYSEFAGDDGKFTGYVKPIFKDIKILDVKEDKNKPLRMIWEAGIGLVSMIFKNHPQDQLATKIPVSGDISKPSIDVWQTVIHAIENAFVKAINPNLDGTIDLGDLEASETELRKEDKEQKREERMEERTERKAERKERRAERKEKKSEEKAR